MLQNIYDLRDLFERLRKKDYKNVSEFTSIAFRRLSGQEHGSPGWLGEQVYMLVHTNPGDFSAVRALLEAHLDHDRYTKIRLNIYSSLNTDRSFHFNQVVKDMFYHFRFSSRNEDNKNFYSSLYHVLDTKKSIDLNESESEIIRHMDQLSAIKSTEELIRKFVDTAKGSVEDFTRKFNWFFNIDHILMLSEKRKGKKNHQTRDDLKRMAENRRAAVLTLVNNARNELGGASPRPPPRPKRTSPEQEAVNIGFAATYREASCDYVTPPPPTDPGQSVGFFSKKNGTLFSKSSKENAFTIQRRTMALRTWISTLDCQEVRDEAAPASAWRAFLRALAQSRSTFDFGMDHF